MCDYEQSDQFDHNARLGRLSLGQAILTRRQNPNMWDSANKQHEQGQDS